ncbi:hypothetical protein GWK47_037633 [Chionoecetes opilio]|uniref:Uncharacterized protein n=1 Tax=Chionoecetes opilio TaxID=41210 RepID=A0A8J4YDA3_CHIOP|nr:hypothetical protein GWK47_037633 [Chionoecetes opilio]
MTRPWTRWTRSKVSNVEVPRGPGRLPAILSASLECGGPPARGAEEGKGGCPTSWPRRAWKAQPQSGYVRGFMGEVRGQADSGREARPGQPPLGPKPTHDHRLIQRGHTWTSRLPQPPYSKNVLPTVRNYIPAPAVDSTSSIEGAREYTGCHARQNTWGAEREVNRKKKRDNGEKVSPGPRIALKKGEKGEESIKARHHWKAPPPSDEGEHLVHEADGHRTHNGRAGRHSRWRRRPRFQAPPPRQGYSPKAGNIQSTKQCFSGRHHPMRGTKHVYRSARRVVSALQRQTISLGETVAPKLMAEFFSTTTSSPENNIDGESSATSWSIASSNFIRSVNRGGMLWIIWLLNTGGT